jgi:Domain of unknown function (DUF3291)
MSVNTAYTALTWDLSVVSEMLCGEEKMSFVSLTRLRIRSIRFLPRFAFHTWRSLQQVKRAPGFLAGALLPDRCWTFWTMTAWENQESMRQYMVSGSHKTAMSHLLEWCDEASVAHWTQPDATLPSWAEADKRMRKDGRPSKVRSPSPQHADLSYRRPRTTAGAKILRS